MEDSTSAPSAVGSPERARRLNAKQKGNRGEYSVRDLLRAFGYKANRTPMSGAIPTWKGDITSEFPFFLEVKNTDKTTFIPWYEKASEESGAKPPMICWIHKGQIYAFAQLTDIIMFGKGKVSQPVGKPQKPVKLGLDETSQLMYSKKHQVRR